ncbi:MAG: hypothetical protein KGH89_05710 [Thaumarchaeota archaeon]|nr:hypothetical protein [Nitrososphaerota archaeon]
MRFVPVAAGALLAIISIPAYYYSPSFLTNTVHTFIGSLSNGNTMSAAGMLRQMGYPPLHQVILIFQYLLIGMTFAGFGSVAFGLVAKKNPKPMIVRLAVDEQLEGSHIEIQPRDSKTSRGPQANVENDKEVFEAVNGVLSKLETELKEMKVGYEDHRQQIESEKKKLEQKQREKMAKIIATGEVLIKEITPDKFEERVKYYIDLTNEENGQPIELSLLAERFDRMKKKMDSKGGCDITKSEFDNLKDLLD